MTCRWSDWRMSARLWVAKTTAALRLPQLLEPAPDPLGEERVEQEGPGLVEDDQRRPAVEARLDPVEEVEQDRDDHLLAQVHQVRDLEDLEAGGAEGVALGVEQRAEGPGQGVGPQGLAHLAALDLDARSR